jgi:hypothetical protein
MKNKLSSKDSRDIDQWGVAREEDSTSLVVDGQLASKEWGEKFRVDLFP